MKTTGKSRRGFLKGASAAAGAAATTTLAAPAIAQGKIRWRMVTCWPKNFPMLPLPNSSHGCRMGHESEPPTCSVEGM